MAISKSWSNKKGQNTYKLLIHLNLSIPLSILDFFGFPGDKTIYTSKRNAKKAIMEIPELLYISIGDLSLGNDDVVIKKRFIKVFIPTVFIRYKIIPVAIKVL